jgi:hypothetical protein
VFTRTLFGLTPHFQSFIGFYMSATKTRWCWRKDLSQFRGLTDRERAGFLLVLEWFENFRLRHELAAGRDAAKVFWRSEVLREGSKRENWQIEQWGDAIQWSRKGLCPTRS